MWVQGNTSTTHGSEPLLSHGQYCLLGDKSTGVEAAPTQSFGLARHGSVTKQHQLFIPFNITPDVERRLHVSLSSANIETSFNISLMCAGRSQKLKYRHMLQMVCNTTTAT